MDEFERISLEVFGSPKVTSTLAIGSVPSTPPDAEKVEYSSFDEYNIAFDGFRSKKDYDNYLFKTSIKLKQTLLSMANTLKADEALEYLDDCLSKLNSMRQPHLESYWKDFKVIDNLSFKEKKELWPNYDGSKVPDHKFEKRDKIIEFNEILAERLDLLIAYTEDLIESKSFENLDRESSPKKRKRTEFGSFFPDTGFYTPPKRTLEHDLTKLYKHLSGSFLDNSVTFKDFTSIFMGRDVDPKNKLPWIGFKGDLYSFIYYMPDHLAGQKRKSSKNKIASKVFCLKSDKGEIEDFDNIQLGKFDPTENELAIKEWYENL